MKPPRAVVSVCVNRRDNPSRPACHARGALALLRALRVAAPAGHDCRPATCLGHCQQGPVVKIHLHDRECIITGARLDEITALLRDA